MLDNVIPFPRPNPEPVRLVVLADAPELELGEEVPLERPRVRGDCVDGPRPCPWVSCKYHLYLDVRDRLTPPTSRWPGFKINFKGLEPDELQYSCALDEAEHGGLTLEQVAERIGGGRDGGTVVRERVRQIEFKALAQLYRPAKEIARA